MKERDLNKLDKIILHCSATKDGVWYDVEDITRWHLNRGWATCGYHYVITLDGVVEVGRPIINQGAHVRGHNQYSIGVCYIGGLDRYLRPADTMNDKQVRAFEKLVDKLRFQYGHLPLHGHNEFSNKACPSFDVATKFGYLK